MVSAAGAQDTLPRFSVAVKGPGKILISWHNGYKGVTQINIQRSTDSARNFTTLLSVPDPTLPENGVVDNKATHPNFFYRLFIVMEEGKYLFTPSRRPSSATGGPAAAEIPVDEEAADPVLAKAGSRVLFADPANSRGKQQVRTPVSIKNMQEIDIKTWVFVKRGDSILYTLPSVKIRNFRDSVLNRTRDTLVFVDGDSLLIKPFVPKEVYKVSPFVYTSKYGNIQVSLPEAAKKHYSVKFFDDNNKLLFELSSVKTSSLIIDKSDFMHAGWFRFELYEGDQLKEKNKLFIPKEF